MLDLSALKEPVADLLAEELEQVTLIFERQLASELSSVNRLCLHIERYRGKMLRPTLVLLSGLACSRNPGRGDSIDERHRTIAAVVEMIHMATLVHDDVLDEADVRRGGATVNSTWGDETAVMLGDYLISNAFHLCSMVGDPAINLALGEVTNTLCEGELMQIHHRGDWGLDEATYFEIVRRKTSSLIGECCRLGATLARARDDVAEGMRRFGIGLGTAFQIRDDLLDIVGDQAVVGKSLGTDLDKGKLTLPLIQALEGTSQAARGELLQLLERRDVESVRRHLVESGAVEATEATARRVAEEARAALPRLPASSARNLLELFADTVVSRAF